MSLSVKLWLKQPIGHVIAWWMLVIGLIVSPAAWSAPAVALGYIPKYPPHFSHFDYVNPTAPQGGTLTLPALGGFDTLNPFTLKGDKEAGIAMLLFDSLAEKSWDEPFTVYGLLAEDIALAEDGLSVTFRLNAAARFSDGSVVEAADVKHSFDTLTQDPAAHPRFRAYWSDIKQAVVLDKRHIRFDFKRRNAELHMIIAELPVFSRRWGGQGQLGKQPLTPPLASGPYLLTKYQLGKNSEFKKNPHYWAKNHPVRRGMFNFDRIRFRYLLDDTVRLEAFKAGEFDVVAENIAKTWARSYRGAAFDEKRILKHTFPNQNPTGMQGFVMNQRRAVFADRRVRQALALAFDFDWANRQLFYGQYRRSQSYFSNSELAAQGTPSAAELALLNPLREHLPAAVFGPAVTLPASPDAFALRNNLLQARQLLFEAGWLLSPEGKLVDAQGRPFRFEFLTFSKTYERIVAPYQRNLARLGIELAIRTVDSSIYQQKLNQFDFDMTVAVYGMSLSPGNELRDYFSTASADQLGSLNLAGVKHPALERLLDHFVSFRDRNELVTASRALDRVLRAEYLLVPNWHLATHRVAWWDKFAYPQQLPLYYQAQEWMIHTWWQKPVPQAKQ